MKYTTIIPMVQDFIDKKIFLQNVGKNIRLIRKSRKISQENLAFMINSARNFIGCIERGEKAPTIYTLYKISKVLDISVDELLMR